jgi:hypothetical protein
MDICDTPYWETIAAVREVGYKLYSIRAGKDATAAGMSVGTIRLDAKPAK